MSAAPYGLAVVTRGDHAFGMGNLVRVRNLLRAVRARRPDARALAAAPGDPVAVAHLGASGFRVVPLPPELGARCARLTEALGEFRPDLVVHDALASDPEVLRTVRPLTPRLVTVDDAGPAAALADLRIDALHPCVGAGADPGVWSRVGDVWLDEAFRTARARYRVRRRPRRVLVSQGGADTFGQVPRLVRALGALDTGVELVVVVGRAFMHHAELAAAAQGCRGAVRVLHDVTDMPGLIATCDLAISGGGLTLFELCCVGVPTIALTAEPRETTTIARFADGAAIGLGLWTPDDGDTLRDLVVDLLRDGDRRRALSAVARARVDGRGLSRFLDEVGVRRDG